MNLGSYWMHFYGNICIAWLMDRQAISEEMINYKMSRFVLGSLVNMKFVGDESLARNMLCFRAKTGMDLTPWHKIFDSLFHLESACAGLKEDPTFTFESLIKFTFSRGLNKPPFLILLYDDVSYRQLRGLNHCNTSFSAHLTCT